MILKSPDSGHHSECSRRSALGSGMGVLMGIGGETPDPDDHMQRAHLTEQCVASATDLQDPAR